MLWFLSILFCISSTSYFHFILKLINNLMQELIMIGLDKWIDPFISTGSCWCSKKMKVFEYRWRAGTRIILNNLSIDINSFINGIKMWFSLQEISFLDAQCETSTKNEAQVNKSTAFNNNRCRKPWKRLSVKSNLHS